MRQVIINFLRLEALNTHYMVYWGLAFVWMLLLVASVMSLRQLKIGSGAKWAWFAFIVALPGLGLALYACRCIVKADWSMLSQLLQSKKLAKRQGVN